MRTARRIGPLSIAPFVLLLAGQLPGQRPGAPPVDLPLYTGVLPGAPRSTQPEVFTPATAADPIAIVRHVQEPSVRVFLPPRARANGSAIVIYPGGGYGVLAIEHEGWQEARWLNRHGIAAIVVKYRVSDRETAAYGFPVPLLDARQALRLTRANAAAWNIDAHRIGVMGFSAGGHLASMMLTLADEVLPGERRDGVGAVSATPDFGVLVYPVISMHEPWGHRGSADNLLPTLAVPQRARYSTNLRVTDSTPPTILIATQDDDAVPPQNAIAFHQAMIAHHVPGELHIWEKGGHGFGMLDGRPPVARAWLPVTLAWLAGRGLLANR
ncbi:MAG: alpha/beta hydrolase [Gemmatimonadaceae bacterium]|nr:alpha/beta hydrolase [Gemmatimonadaceae bacterium]